MFQPKSPVVPSSPTQISCLCIDMYLPLVATSLSLLRLVRAGQHPLYFDFQENVCSVTQHIFFPPLRVPRIEEEHNHLGTFSLHEPAQSHLREPTYAPWTYKKQR